MSDLQKAFDLQTRIIEELRAELAAAHERIRVLDKYEGVLLKLSTEPHLVHRDMIKQMAGDILKAAEEKEPTE